MRFIDCNLHKCGSPLGYSEMLQYEYAVNLVSFQENLGFSFFEA